MTTLLIGKIEPSFYSKDIVQLCRIDGIDTFAHVTFARPLSTSDQLAKYIIYGHKSYLTAIPRYPGTGVSRLDNDQWTRLTTRVQYSDHSFHSSLPSAT